MTLRDPSPPAIACGHRLEAEALPGFPLVRSGDPLPALIRDTMARAGWLVQDGDVYVVASKVVSRAEGRFADPRVVQPGPEAHELALRTGKDPREVALILAESTRVSRAAAGVLVVRQRGGTVVANAGIDRSNVAVVERTDRRGARTSAAVPNEPVLLYPLDPDRSAEAVRAALAGEPPARIGVVVSDSLGRPFRLGTVGAAIGLAGLPALWDRRGEADLSGRPLEHTFTALADQVAAVGDLVAGQAGEGRAVVRVRGLTFSPVESSASDLHRPADEDLYL